MDFLRGHKHLIFIIIISFLPVIPFYAAPDLLHTHDGLVHLPRLAAYFHALSDGHFPVRFAGYLNYGYGLPLFNFIYQTPYLIGSLFIVIGFSLVNAFKISLLLSFVLSGIFMYLFGKEYFSDQRKGVLVAVFYQFAPFRMVELLVRGSFGEVYTYAFFPLILYGILQLQKKRFVKSLLITSISSALLIISHNSVSLLFMVAAVLFLLITSSQVKNVIRGLIGLFFGLIISSFYWMPAIFEHKYTYGNLFMQNLYKEHFVPFQNLFIPNILNLKQFQTEGITTFIGIFQVVGMLLAAILMLSGKLDKKTRQIFVFSFILLLVSFFLMIPISSSIWGMPISTLLRQFQFPWRFLSLVVVATSFLAVSFPIFEKKFRQKKIFACLILGTIISVIFFWNPSLGYKEIDEKYYWNFPLNTTYYGETDVVWSAGPAKAYPKLPIELISGKGVVTDFVKKNNYQTFITKSSEKIELVSHTQYFPGWRAYVNGYETPIQFQDPNHRGLLVFTVPKGKNLVVLRFEENKLRTISDLLSVAGLLSLISVAFLLSKNH